MSLNYDENTILEFGAAAEAILCSPVFNRLLAAWDDATVKAMLATKPDEHDDRERKYAQVNAVREFIAFMQEFVLEARKLQEPPDPMAQIDDPAVHDIYRRETDYQ